MKVIRPFARFYVWAALCAGLLVLGACADVPTPEPNPPLPAATAAATRVAETPAPAATDTPVPTPTVTPEPGDLQPLSEAACAELAGAMGHTLGLRVTVGQAAIQDAVRQKQGGGCRIVAGGPGSDFVNFVGLVNQTQPPLGIIGPDLATAVRGLLTAQGWQANDAYAADGATGTASGFQQESALCLLDVVWEPVSAGACPADQPLGGCQIPLAQQRYTVSLNCAYDTTVTPTVTPPAPALGLAVRSFQVSLADQGTAKAATFTWETSGASQARIVSGTSQRFPPTWTVAPSGTLTVILTDTNVANPVMTLIASDETGNQVTQSVTATWPCRYTYFFTPAPDTCPVAETLKINGAVETFEHGRIIWMRQIGTPGAPVDNQIFVLYEDGTLQQFTDTWIEGEPESDPTLVAPAGLLQPIRGFGTLWRADPDLRARIGWATDAEHAIDGMWQEQIREAPPRIAYIGGIDGQTVRLSGFDTGTWQFVEQTSGQTVPSATTLPRPLYFIRTSDGQIVRVEVDGTTVNQVTAEAGALREFDVSPVDGSLVYVVGNDLVRSDALGKARTVLVEGSKIDDQSAADQWNSRLDMPRWSPDGKQIAFAMGGVNLVAAAGGKPDVIQANDKRSDFSSAASLADAGTRYFWPRAWSPDGKSLLLGISFTPVGCGRAVKNLGNDALIALDAPCMLGGFAAWSLDSQTLYQSNPAQHLLGDCRPQGLLSFEAATGRATGVISAAGSDPTQQTLVAAPFQAPDGNLRLFLTSGTQLQIYQSLKYTMVRAAPDGSERTALRSDAYEIDLGNICGADDTTVLWAPDGGGAVIHEQTSGELLWLAADNSPTLSLPATGSILRWGVSGP